MFSKYQQFISYQIEIKRINTSKSEMQTCQSSIVLASTFLHYYKKELIITNVFINQIWPAKYNPTSFF